ncbi:MAG: prepilin-type N-terminal cleavage/methylation domain-containing protein [Candidatus Omnitrophota bacterium]
MYRFIPAPRSEGRRAFTLVEIMIAMFIALYTISAAVGAYVMFWTWWHETNPEIEAARIARIALSTVVRGRSDPTAGTYTVGTTVYTRRNGIAGAIRAPTFPMPAPSQQIDFGLETDAANSRSYFLGPDGPSGFNAVYCMNNDGVISIIPSTLGITDLRFQYYTDPAGIVYDNMIVVTATVEKDIVGGLAPHRVHVVYSELVSLINVS